MAQDKSTEAAQCRDSQSKTAEGFWVQQPQRDRTEEELCYLSPEQVLTATRESRLPSTTP